jgi:hypothetical protein
MTIYSARGFSNKIFPKHITTTIKPVSYDMGLDLYNRYKPYDNEFLDATDIIVLLEFEGEDCIFYILTYKDVIT